MNKLNQASAQKCLVDEITVIYRRLSEGKDVSPAQHFYLEGQAKLLLDFDIVSYVWLKAQVNALYVQYMGQEIDKTFWLWSEEQGQFMLPIKMHKAPVYKG
ncbi:MAG: hypothetical protein HRU20_14125 [Pseudomonadales bacterium]|nr:hypothetical protein [Pseudomonadales bacterium]